MHPVLTSVLASALLLAACAPQRAHAQSASCSSDRQPPPRAVVERFISADCPACWAAQPAVAPGPSVLAVDWIVPAPGGDDAALSAAATREATLRLESLGRPLPRWGDTSIADMAPAPARPARLRVAHGPAINDYVGTVVRFVPSPGATGAPYAATLLLVEVIPAGAEGSPVARNVVRNTFYPLWEKGGKLSNSEHQHWTESRSMRIPEGAQADRLRLVGWVQDAHGRVVATAQSVCSP